VALNLFGVIFNDHDHGPIPGTELVVVRDLAAIVTEVPYATQEPDDAHVTRMSDVIAEYQMRSAILPAPVGVVFRSNDSVRRWLELHYVALSDALSFVDDRVVGRVHVWRPGPPEDRETGSDLASAAAESLRALRRSAANWLACPPRAWRPVSSTRCAMRASPMPKRWGQPVCRSSN